MGIWLDLQLSLASLPFAVACGVLESLLMIVQGLKSRRLSIWQNCPEQKQFGFWIPTTHRPSSR